MPTKKQKLLATRILANPLIHEVTNAEMEEVGYSPNTRPQDVITSRGWQELMERKLPDTKLLSKHEQLLDATKPVSARVTNKDAGVDTDDFIEVPDNQTQVKALELAYKVKGRLDAKNQLNISQKQGDLQIELVTYETKDTI